MKKSTRFLLGPVGAKVVDAVQAKRTEDDDVRAPGEDKRPRATLNERAHALKAESATRKEDAREKRAERAATLSEKLAKQSGVNTTGALFVGHSADAGRNATVVLYPDRLERTKAKKFGALSNATQDVEVTPIRAISSVQTSKDGMIHTKVTVYATGNNIEFRLLHADAARFKDALTTLILVDPPAPTHGAPDIADQIAKLAALHEQGILTEEEFAAKKAELLARL